METTTHPAPVVTSEATGGGTTVQAVGTDATAIVPNPNVKKVIVAIHGVGDQSSFATLQAVVNQFCAYYNEPAAVPLGNFHPATDPTTSPPPPPPPYCLEFPPYPEGPLQELAFAEVYWAKIPQGIVSDQHTLEEAKQWARTIVERFRLRWQQTGRRTSCQEADFLRIKAVLTEMIQTLAVLERLCYLADRAGLFSFDLRKLLNDYLGDVQVVAEFRNKKRVILDTFHQTLRSIKQSYANADIYLVAHSEGTVIAFLGLLEALNKLPDEDFTWVKNVRGLMTFGSPIDKHLMLWPKLFPATMAVAWPEGQRKIEWRNYYDYGDPIGFSLRETSEWLKTHQLNRVFSFEEKDDMGFTRYPFPGKAHVDFWQDEEVFGHFIFNVVNEQREDEPFQSKHQKMYLNRQPGDIWWKKWLSVSLPFLVVVGILLAAVYILFQALPDGAGGAGADGSDKKMLQDVVNLGLLLLGVTVATRIPRLTRDWRWRVAGVVLFMGLAALCIGVWPAESAGERCIGEFLKPATAPALPAGIVRLLVAMAVAVLAWVVNVLKPSWGMVPLLLLGTLPILYFVFWSPCISPSSSRWPIFLAAAAFFYLWWLAALIFDLVFVWYVYIREDQAMVEMGEMVDSAVWNKTTKPSAQKPKGR
jgi:hypothetical protein